MPETHPTGLCARTTAIIKRQLLTVCYQHLNLICPFLTKTCAPVCFCLPFFSQSKPLQPRTIINMRFDRRYAPPFNLKTEARVTPFQRNYRKHNTTKRYKIQPFFGRRSHFPYHGVHQAVEFGRRRRQPLFHDLKSVRRYFAFKLLRRNHPARR